MHDLVVFMSVMGGLSAFGILGLLYGPLIVAAFLTMTDLYRTHYRQELAKRFSRQG
jgi:predicted PurR-regulated permease PerM